MAPKLVVEIERHEKHKTECKDEMSLKQSADPYHQVGAKGTVTTSKVPVTWWTVK